MKIPYGLANFATIRREGYFYVDKTPFLPLLESRESGYSSLLFLRPRRMGKSALVSMMEHYYDLARADEFDALFGGLWIHEHPTPEKNRYLVLHLNFSTVSAEGDPQALTLHFSEVIKSAIRTLGMRYGHRIAPLATLYDEVKDHRDPAALMNNELVSERAIPRQMLDSNARTDYGKLHRLWVAAGLDAQERREALETVLETGHVWARLIEQFGRSGPSSFDQTISLLYYTGMLTLSDAPASGNEVCFEIPNQVIRELGWEHFGELLKQEKIVIARSPQA